MSDNISRADAVEAVAKLCVDGYKAKVDGYFIPLTDALINTLSALPSADAESDDLIIKGAKGIQDGLYNIKDGKLFKYKAKGGTVRTYPIVPSANAVDCTDFIEWIRKVVADEELWDLNAVGYGEIICRKLVEIGALATTEKPPYYYVPSADAEFADLPDIPRAYYERIVGNMAHEINMLKEQLESADAEWIPCSEKLPSDDDWVLVTYKTTDRIHLCRYIDDGSENPWWSYIDDCCAWNNVVLAWMPLPKPYREDGEV